MRLSVFLIVFFPLICEAKNVRTLTIDESDVSVIHTAPGLSTMLEFDGKPTSAVLGDQDAFKVEYVGTSLTVKPLISGSKTNLFVFVDYERFNFTLHAGSKSNADYIVRIKAKKRRVAPPPAFEESVPGPAPAVLKESRIARAATRGELKLAVTAIATPPSKSSLIIYFRVSCIKKRCSRLIPLDRSHVTLRQGKVLLPTESLYIDLPALFEDTASATGTLIVRESNLLNAEPLELRFTEAGFSSAGPLSVSFSPFPRAKGK